MNASMNFLNCGSGMTSDVYPGKVSYSAEYLRFYT